jgi:hypothetical protein
MTRPEETAAQLDNAIDAILRGPRGPVAGDEGELVVTARLLHRSLPRLHPGFGFEKLLAARLAAARRMELAPAAAAPMAGPTPIRPGLEAAAPELAAPGVAALDLAAPEIAAPDDARHDDAHDRRRRGLVAGGAIASGVSLALPLAGVAIVAWRRSRSSGGIF